MLFACSETSVWTQEKTLEHDATPKNTEEHGFDSRTDLEMGFDLAFDALERLLRKRVRKPGGKTSAQVS